MIQIKIFTITSTIFELQNSVNKWLKETPITEILKMSQSETDKDFSIVILYRAVAQ